MTIELLIPKVMALTSNSSAYEHSEDDPTVPFPPSIVLSKFDELELDMSNFEVV